MQIDTTFFKKSLILFWTMWWLIALWTDIVGALAHFGLLHATWAPDSNFPFLIETLKMYHAGTWVPIIAFAGILSWSAVSTAVFIFAAASIFAKEKIWFSRACKAFIISLLFWLAFFLADQLVMKFDLEENHMVQGGFELLCFLAMFILPSSNAKNNITAHP